MSFYIRIEQTGDLAVLQCAERIVRGEALHLLRDAVTSLPRARVIVLDLSGVRMIDCGGLGMLIFLHCWTGDNGIQLKVVNPSNFARQMLELTQLTNVLHVSSAEDASQVLCNSDRKTENLSRAVALEKANGLGMARRAFG